MPKMDYKLLKKEAAWVVQMFDQANTNQVVENLGSRARLLKDAIEDLRTVLGTKNIKALTADGVWREAST